MAYLLFTLIFALVGDLLGAWSALGGLAAQLSHLRIVFRLAITENATLAIMYDVELRAHIQRIARVRDDDADFERPLTKGGAEIKHRIKRAG